MYSKRSEARSLGMTRYFTGKACPQGHIAERMVSNGSCVVCTSERKTSSRRKNPEQHKSYMHRWHKENYDREKNYREGKKEHISDRSRVWRLMNPERHAENAKKWRSNNLERSNNNRRAWRKNNRPRCALLAKRWRERNPEKQRTIMFNRNSISRGIRQSIKHGDISQLQLFQNFKCVYCFSDTSRIFDVDHITPIFRGGDNSISNLQILCPSCNRSKGRKTHSEFIKWKESRCS